MSLYNINKLIKHHFDLLVEDIQDPTNYNEDWGIDPYNWDTLEDYANGDIEIMYNEYPWNYVGSLNKEIQEVCDIHITLKIMEYISDCVNETDLDFEIIHDDAYGLIYKYIYFFVKENCVEIFLDDLKTIFEINKKECEKKDVLNFKCIVSPKKQSPSDVDNIIISYLSF